MAGLARSLALLCVFITIPAWAVRLDLGAGIGAEYSDNIGLTPSGGEEAWVRLATVRARVQEISSNVEAEAIGTAEYRNYQTDLFDDEIVFSFDATALWTISPEYFTWSFEDYYRQATVDLFAPPTPENRQDTNVLSTGPELRWRLAPVHTAVAGARYGNFYFEESDADSDRFSGYARWLYTLSPSTTLSLNGEATRVAYVHDRYGDYHRFDSFFRVTRSFVRASLEADIGTTNIQRDEASDVSGFLGRLAWHMSFNSQSGLDAFVLHQYTDAGHDILDIASRDGAVGVVNEQVTGDLFYNRHSELAYHWRGLRTSFRVAGALRDEDFQTTPRDRQFNEAMARVGYEVGPTVTAALSASWVRADYRRTDVVHTDRHTGVGITWRLNTNITSHLELNRVQRESSLLDAEYKENRAIIRFVYERTPFME